MSNKIPLSEQVSAGQTVLYEALAAGTIDEDQRPAVEQLCKTLEWIKFKGDVIKVAAKISDDEWLKEAKKHFPDSEITGVTE